MKIKIFILSLVVLPLSMIYGQTRTVGLFINDTVNAYKGYTVFAPKHNTMTYIINNEGRKCHEWTASTYNPGQSVYLLENGHLLRTCMIMGSLGSGGGEGGRIEEYDWDDNLVWEFNYSTADYTQHHDVKKLPNGNIIMLVVEKKSYAECITAGFDPSKFQPDIAQKGYMLPDCIIEIQPTYPSGGNIVWEWHVWDHLIQDFDASKNNFGVVAAHPELVDCDGDHRNLPLFWNHMNCIDYNPALDQIAMSVRGNSEVWLVDHSTTTAQSAGHTGGNHGKGGDLLYRWGNPLTYGAGTINNEVYVEQHDAEWIKPDCPGAGNILCFNNGVSRNYSSIDEITPPVDASGNYPLNIGSAWAPVNLTWTYVATPPESLFAHDISGAQRLQNGNTLIDDGPLGTFIEVTPAGDVVWKYINPTINTGPIYWNDSLPYDPTHPEETLNSVFRVYRYPPDYSAFDGKDLTPGDFIELYNTAGTGNIGKDASSLFRLDQNYPNPAATSTTISFQLFANSRVNLALYDLSGRQVRVLADEVKDPGQYNVHVDLKSLQSGIYLYSLKAGNSVLTKRMTVLNR
ncbi:MAG: aryl-sulfate sulfotransferase [Bacteroidetes bacterium]|nr:aryl-sulfate sulfotransferase [Bacteroidota bacterium]